MKILNLIQRNIWVIAILAGLTLLYFLIRLPNLTYLPVFADEAIYIRWAQVMKSEPTLRFLPLSDGKTPLYMWMLMPLLKVFDDPLLAGRILSVFAGYFTVLGILFIGWRFINVRVGLWAAFLMVVTPFFVFFDRMALVDSTLAAFSVWSIAIGLLIIKYPRFDLGMVLGYLMGGALLTKTPAFFTILTMPLTALTFNFRSVNREKRILRLFLVWIVAIVITLGIYNILRLGPGFSSLSSRNQDYVLSPLDIIDRPLDPFIPHLHDLYEWFPVILGYGVLLFLGWGILQTFIKRNVYLIALLLISVTPLVIELALLRTFTARYILFPVTYLMIITAFGIDDLVSRLSKKISAKLMIGLIVLIMSVWPTYYIYFLHFDIENSPMPRVEKNGYLREWTAGFGLKEIAAFLDQESRKQDIVVGTDGGFGTLPDGLQIYIDKNRKIAVVGGVSSPSAQLNNAAKSHPTYFVANKSKEAIFQENLELVKSYPKVPSEDGFQEATMLYKVIYKEEMANK
jgi:4-amino-4-deoxy-L-arabinose transferase-like glycosyltransferase